MRRKIVFALTLALAACLGVFLFVSMQSPSVEDKAQAHLKKLGGEITRATALKDRLRGPYVRVSVGREKVTDELLASLREAGLLYALNNDWVGADNPEEHAARIFLSDSRVTDVGLKELASLECLTGLSLSKTKVTDVGLKELTHHKKLAVLDLSGTQVTDVGLKELAPLKSLAHLNLSYTKVTDAGLKELAPLQNLIMLDLRSTKVTDAGLRDLVPHLKQLISLHLDDGQATDGVLATLREVGLLRCLANQAKNEDGNHASKPEDFVRFDLSRTQVTDAGLKEITSLKNITRLDLFNTQVTDAGLKELAPLKNLTTLCVDERVVTDAWLKGLREAGLLHALCFARGKDGKRPTKVEEVTALNLDETNVTDAGLKELVAFKDLSRLDLDGTTVTDVGLKQLALRNNLTELWLRHTKVTTAGVKGLQEALPKCDIKR